MRFKSSDECGRIGRRRRIELAGSSNGLIQIWRRARLRLLHWRDALSGIGPTRLRFVKMPWYEGDAAEPIAARLEK